MLGLSSLLTVVKITLEGGGPVGFSAHAVGATSPRAESPLAEQAGETCQSVKTRKGDPLSIASSVLMSLGFNCNPNLTPIKRYCRMAILSRGKASM